MKKKKKKVDQGEDRPSTTTRYPPIPGLGYTFCSYSRLRVLSVVVPPLRCRFSLDAELVRQCANEQEDIGSPWITYRIVSFEFPRRYQQRRVLTQSPSETLNSYDTATLPSIGLPRDGPLVCRSVAAGTWCSRK